MSVEMKSNVYVSKISTYLQANKKDRFLSKNDKTLSKNLKSCHKITRCENCSTTYFTTRAFFAEKIKFPAYCSRLEQIE